MREPRSGTLPAVTSETVLIDGVRLELRRHAGQSAPILMLHEGLGSISAWRDFPARLAQMSGHETIVWSRQGFGRSQARSQAPGRDDLRDEGEVVCRLMDALGIERAHLYGHSDGASIALVMAALHPDRIESLILEAPHVTIEPATLPAIEAAVEAFRTGDLKARLARHHDDPDQVFANWSDTWLSPDFRDWSIEDLLPRVEAPALMIQGTSDVYFSMGQLDRIAAVLASTERLELCGCGHSPHRERTDEVLAAVTRFLATAIQRRTRRLQAPIARPIQKDERHGSGKQ